MSDHSKIEWTDATWQIASGCTPMSAGCRNCYSARLAGTRLKNHPRCQGLTAQASDGRHVWTGEVRMHPDQLLVPLRWQRPRKIFVGDRTDLFHESVPDAMLDQIFAVMALTPHHTYQILTKRPERMQAYVLGISGDDAPFRRDRQRRLATAARRMAPMPAPMTMHMVTPLLLEDADGQVLIDLFKGWPARRDHARAWPLSNVHLGVSFEDQASADARIPHLLDTPAAVRWGSYEPALGGVDIVPFLGGRAIKCKCGWHKTEFNVQRLNGGECCLYCGSQTETFPTLDWVVMGGESGPRARPMHPDWARSLRDQCAEADVPFFFKGWGEWAPHTKDIETEEGDINTTPRGGANWHSFDGGISGVFRVGKRAAGRLLDGVEHNGLPLIAAAAE